jgi:hypothetical protein
LLKSIVVSSVTIFLALPGSAGGLAGLRKAAQETGFDKGYPVQFEKISQYINVLLYVLIEHWLAWAILSIFCGTIWVLLVTEPKVAALKDFQEARKSRIGE